MEAFAQELTAAFLNIMREYPNLFWLWVRFIVQLVLFTIAGIWVAECTCIVMSTWEPLRVWAGITIDRGGRVPTDFLYWVPFAPRPARTLAENRGALQPRGLESNARTSQTGSPTSEPEGVLQLQRTEPRVEASSGLARDVGVDDGTRASGHQVEGEVGQHAEVFKELVAGDTLPSLSQRATHSDVRQRKTDVMLDGQGETVQQANKFPTAAETDWEIVSLDASDRIHSGTA
jgi:hypothetical protein